MYDLHEVAETLVAHGKGILATDDSPHTEDARLAEYGIEANEDMRRRYRDVFLNTPDIEKHLSGVILCEETFNQKTNDGTSFPDLLASKNILSGVKVDQGLEPMAESPEEKITKGLIGLRERLVPIREAGASFTKWRAVVRIDGDRLPSAHSLLENAKRLAMYALTAQQAGLVPILEPEVLLNGKHSRLRAKEVITATMNTLFSVINDLSVDRTALLIKTSMALSGSDSGRTDTPEEVAESTLEALKASVPVDVPGIVFLSGGQSPDQATDNLNAITKIVHNVHAPWPLTYSYDRALQLEGLAIWKGKDENIIEARKAFLSRLEKISSAIL